MKFGICSPWGQSLDEFRAQVKTAHTSGFEIISISDSPAGWRELYVSMTVAALDAPGAMIASLVSSPFLRHPIVSAAALSSIYDLNGGRVVLGFATGGSNVMAIGRKQATQREIRAEILSLQALLRGEPTEVDGRPVMPLRFPRPVPIYYSAFGPKAMALAGELADGVILFAGDRHLDALERNIAVVRESARAHGRDPAKLEIWVVSYFSVRDNRSEAIADLKAFIVCNALASFRTPEQMARVPADIRPPLEELQRRYDVTEHVVVGGKNAILMEELGLTEFLSDLDTIAGSPAEVAETLRKIEGMGASAFIAALPGNADPLGTIERLAKVRANLP